MAMPSTRDDDKPDMTPMIDVVFLMIVFFVCIEFKTLESKLDAFLPTDRGSSPRMVEPIEQLSVQVHVVDPGKPVYRDGEAELARHPQTGRPPRFALTGHRVRWQVGPKACEDFAAALREIERLAADPHSQLPDPDSGGKKLMACVIDGHAGTRYDDVARTADLCRAAGFDDIHFGAGRASR